jgi:hypothetical protein
MELLDGGTGPARAHVETCTECRSRVDEVRQGLQLAREAEVPEPSPLYWEAFRRQVGRRISDERPAARAWRLVPALAALAAVVAFAVVTSHHAAVRDDEPAPTLPAWSALPPSDQDAGLDVLQALSPSAEDLGVVESCRGVESCVVDLNDDESRALVEVLRGEMEGRPL